MMEQPPPVDRRENNRTSVCIAIGVLVCFLTMSISMFYGGSVFYGMVLLAFPIAAVFIGCGVYFSKRNSIEGESDHFVVSIPEEEEHLERDHESDAPPTYRLTWRRSFMRRLRSRKLIRTESRATENGSHRSGQDTPPSPQSPADLPDIVVWPSQEENEEQPSAETPKAMKHSRPASIHNVFDPPDTRETSEEGDGLPTYEEAIQLSREHLNEVT